MKKLITGCAFPIILFALFFYGYASVYLQRFEPAWWAYLFAAVGALMLILLIGSVRMLFQSKKNAAVIRRAQKMKPPKDGKLTLIQGIIKAVGETIESPFSKTSCVAYEYSLSRSGWVKERFGNDDVDYRKKSESFAFGVAKTAYVISTSGGDVRPLGYPTLEYFPNSAWHFSAAGTEQIRQRTEAFLKNETFEKAGGLRLAKALSQMVKDVADDIDSVRRNWKVCDPKKLKNTGLIETCLRPGDQVCAIGKWDAKKRELHPPVELVHGNIERAKELLMADKRSGAAIGIIFGLVVTALLVVLAMFTPELGPMSRLSPEARPFRDSSLDFALQSASPDVVRELCDAGMDPNQPNTLGTLPVFRTRDADKVQVLLECGADPDARNKQGETRLIEAAQYGDVKIVRVLLDAEADVEAKAPHLGRDWTAMVSAYTNGYSEIVEMLTDFGAHDERVTAATGTPLTVNSAPLKTVRAYLAAIQAGDLETMKRLSTGKRPGWSDEVNIENWKKYYPAELNLKQGFGNSKAATIELESHRFDNYQLQWFFHLEYAAEENSTPRWRILREWKLTVSK